MSKSFKQIQFDEWQRGDYRSRAVINRKSEELLSDFPVIFDEYEAEGLGRAKTAFFLTSNNRQFAITEYLEPIVPITEIVILNNPETLDSDLAEVLELLNLSTSDLDFIYKY